MSAEPRCRYCGHLWRWHHRPERVDLPGECSRCECDVWGQPPAYLSADLRSTIVDLVADATERAVLAHFGAEPAA